MWAEHGREKLAWQTTRTNRSRIQTVFVLAFIAFLWLLGVLNVLGRRTHASTSPYAYVTLLARHPDHDNKTIPDHEDLYYQATRTLAYQLIHAPDTRTNTSIPFIVLATQDIAPHKLQRLEQDGAIVHVVDNIGASWMHPGLPKWRHTLCKLHLFALTTYQKVLFLDADILIVKRLDTIFMDETTTPRHVERDLSVDDEGPLPDTYMLSAQAAFETAEHEYPASAQYNRQGHLGAGFFLTQPSLKIYEYYLKLLTLEGRFRDNAMEQDLLSYAHRRDGPMPWTDITYTWTTTWPSMKEYQAGAVTLHEKFWEENLKVDLGIRKLWYLARGEMEGYWFGRQEGNR